MIFKSNPLEETYTETVFGFHESTHCKLSGINVTLLINLNSQITSDVVIEINNRTETAYQLITVYFYVGYIIANLGS